MYEFRDRIKFHQVWYFSPPLFFPNYYVKFKYFGGNTKLYTSKYELSHSSGHPNDPNWDSPGGWNNVSPVDILCRMMCSKYPPVVFSADLMNWSIFLKRWKNELMYFSQTMEKLIKVLFSNDGKMNQITFLKRWKNELKYFFQTMEKWI